MRMMLCQDTNALSQNCRLSNEKGLKKMKFEPRKKYRSNNGKFVIEIFSRTPEYIRFRDFDGRLRKSIIRIDEIDEKTEMIRPDNHKNAPVYRASDVERG